MSFTAANDNGMAHRTTGFSGDNEWYTPERYVEMARTVMGGIDVDPASNEIAQRTVKATTYYTAETDGLAHEWHGRVWMNPPFGKALIGKFISKLALEYSAGRCREAVVLTNNATDTRWFSCLNESASEFCFTRGRVKFESPSGEIAATALGQVFTYLGPNPLRFEDVFADVGHVFTPVRGRASERLAA